MLNFLDKGDDLLFTLFQGPFEFMVSILQDIRDYYPIEVLVFFLAG